MSDDDQSKPVTLWGPLARQMAIRRTEELLLKGYRPSDIASELSEEGTTLSVDTIAEYCREIRRQWAEEDLEVRPARRDMWRARLEARYRKMLADLDDPTMKMSGVARAMLYRSISALEQLAFSLDGLDAPIKVEHSGGIDVRAMSPEMRRERISELLRKREQALASGGN